MEPTSAIPPVGDGSGLEPGPQFHVEELQLAFRNKALPLEGLHYDVTPTGMHYTLTHFDVPWLDAESFTLTLRGALDRPRSFTLGELKRHPTRTLRVTLECAGDGRGLLAPRPVSQPWLTGGVSTAEWTGTSLTALLHGAGLHSTARSVLFKGADRGIEGGVVQDYERGLTLDEALSDDVLLAWDMNGRPLEPQHGFPLRLVVPGWYGMAHVKWLNSIEVSPEAPAGYQNVVAYRYSQRRDEPGEPVTLMRVRSLMVPPGIPDFLTRTRMVQRGEVELFGRAWCGRTHVTHVQVTTDGGGRWSDAELEKPTAPNAWQAWRYRWLATEPGPRELGCRAWDTNGNVQPIEPYWTARGMGNNQVHRVRVIVV